MAITPEDYVKRLEGISVYKGTTYGRALSINEREAEYTESIQQFKGYLALSNAFKCFFLETVELVNTECRPRLKGPLSEHYALFVPRLSHSFQSLCGAERVAIRGYPYHGYTLLRNTFDNLVLTSAALQKLTDFYAIEGVIPGKEFDPDEARKLRKQTEWSVRDVMTGKKSGLSEETLDELAKWDALFDYETHGARLSLTEAVGWMKGQEPLRVLPRFTEAAFAMFMNRFSEVAWMTHRLTPAVQPAGIGMGASWQEKWRVLDDSFELIVHSLTAQLGKKIGAAVVELVKTKFPFTGISHFPL